MKRINIRWAFFALLVICMFVGVLFMTAWSAGADGIDITDEFIDPIFRSIIYARIGKTAPEPILDTDVTGITELRIHNRGIQSLAGLTYLTNLQALQCQFNLLTELDVTGLPLTVLHCEYNYMKDESAVVGFTGTWDGIRFMFHPQWTGSETDSSLVFSIADGHFRVGGVEYTGQPDAWSWNEETQTLTLKGMEWISPTAAGLFIRDGEELTIEVIGENRFESDAVNGIHSNSAGLTFIGNGTLYARGSEPIVSHGGTGIRVPVNKTITIDGPTIHAQGVLFGITCSGLILNSGELHVVAERHGLHSTNSITNGPAPLGTIINGGMLTAIADLPVDRMVINAPEYRWWVNTAREDPGGEGTAFPPAAYRAISNLSFVKIDARGDVAPTPNQSIDDNYHIELAASRTAGNIFSADYTIRNEADDKGDLMVFAAIYDQRGIMRATNMADVKVAKGSSVSNRVSVTVPAGFNPNDVVMKAFIWEGGTWRPMVVDVSAGPVVSD